MQFILRFVSVHFEMGGYIIIEKRLLWYDWFFDPSRYSWNIVESGDKHQTIESSVFTLRWEICYCSNNSWYMYMYIYVSPHFCGETYCFCPVRLSVTQFVSATPLKLLNRISWNLVGNKDTICSCAYYQEMLIP